jgi:hypothetical protein
MCQITYALFKKTCVQSIWDVNKQIPEKKGQRAFKHTHTLSLSLTCLTIFEATC